VGSGLEYYTVFVFERSGSAKYAVVQVPLRFRFDRDVLLIEQSREQAGLGIALTPP
jgi:hypothetical protein